jgi:hypothetical protein
MAGRRDDQLNANNKEKEMQTTVLFVFLDSWRNRNLFVVCRSAFSKTKKRKVKRRCCGSHSDRKVSVRYRCIAAHSDDAVVAIADPVCWVVDSTMIDGESHANAFTATNNSVTLALELFDTV